MNHLIINISVNPLRVKLFWDNIKRILGREVDPGGVSPKLTL